MIRTLIHLLRTGNATQSTLFPELAPYSRGLPTLTDQPCTADSGCSSCVDICPTQAIQLETERKGSLVTLDLGRCIACGGCTDICPTGTIEPNRRTTTAVRDRSDLVLTNKTAADFSEPDKKLPVAPFYRSLHIREVATGDNASDLEVGATTNPIFDSSRFGIHFVASPRFADALLVTGPVGRAMHKPLLRCFDAMAEPRIVIAAGVSAISGGLHSGGYAEADGVDSILPVAVYVPGHPPHPWYILHGLLLAMGRATRGSGPNLKPKRQALAAGDAR